VVAKFGNTGPAIVVKHGAVAIQNIVLISLIQHHHSVIAELNINTITKVVFVVSNMVKEPEVIKLPLGAIMYSVEQ